MRDGVLVEGLIVDYSSLLVNLSFLRVDSQKIFAATLRRSGYRVRRPKMDKLI